MATSEGIGNHVPNNVEVLVRGRARDFDDIYEGTPLEIIATRDELSTLLRERFGISVWVSHPKRKNMWVGSNSAEPRISVELWAHPDGRVVMITTKGIEDSEVAKFAEELGLSLFE